MKFCSIISAQTFSLLFCGSGNVSFKLSLKITWGCDDNINASLESRNLVFNVDASYDEEFGDNWSTQIGFELADLVVRLFGEFPGRLKPNQMNF